MGEGTNRGTSAALQGSAKGTFELSSETSPRSGVLFSNRLSFACCRNTRNVVSRNERQGRLVQGGGREKPATAWWGSHKLRAGT